MHTRSNQIERLLGQEKWGAARQLIRLELGRLPKDEWIRHWWLDRLSSTYFEEENYPRALEAIQEAAAIAPNCPLVQWDLAGTLAMSGETHEAIAIYRKLIARGAPALANGQCGEGEEWARALVTDCYFWLGLCYEDLGDAEEALRSFRWFLSRKSHGSGSLYSDDDALGHMASIRMGTGKLPAVARKTSAKIEAVELGAGSIVAYTACPGGFVLSNPGSAIPAANVIVSPSYQFWATTVRMEYGGQGQPQTTPSEALLHTAAH